VSFGECVALDPTGRVEPAAFVVPASKRAIDCIGAAVGLLVAAPILALAAIAIRLDSRGPAFLAQERCGLGGSRFTMWKLRTMVEDAEARRAELLHRNLMDGPVFKVADDPRVTRVGRVLRRFSLDELPQLWNVLRGEMSLVGPRPITVAELTRYGRVRWHYLSIAPGMTGLWQVSGRNNTSYEERVALDERYVEQRSLWLDLSILLRTLKVVIARDGAH
jgi:lipopolysaccharide/colanic/teichoic acid biosynthesis glycosyltransferase